MLMWCRLCQGTVVYCYPCWGQSHFSTHPFGNDKNEESRHLFLLGMVLVVPTATHPLASRILYTSLSIQENLLHPFLFEIGYKTVPFSLAFHTHPIMSQAGGGGVWSQSLLLSVLAGASTCIGAAVPLIRPKNAPLRKAHLAAALSLAGSVMVTVSFFSLLPEALEGPTSGELFDLTTKAFLERLASFLVGGGLYWALSKCAFPEPEEILGFEDGDKKHGEVAMELVPLIEMKQSPLKQSPSLKRKSSLRIRGQTSSVLSKDEENPSESDSNSASVLDDPQIDDKKSAATPTASKAPWWMVYSAGQDLASADARRAWRVTLLLFISLAVHNFPEGLYDAYCGCLVRLYLKVVSHSSCS